MTRRELLVLGGGIELRRVLTMIEELSLPLYGVIPWNDSEIPDHPLQATGVPFHQVVGCLEDLPVIGREKLASVVLALSRPSERALATVRCRETEVPLATLLSQHAIISRNSRIEQGCLVEKGCIVESESRLGNGVLMLPGSRVGLGVRCGDHSVLGPGVSLDDDVRVGEEVHLGDGSRVLAGNMVGRSAVVLPGSLITSDVEPGRIVGGIPAEVVGHSVFSSGS